MWTKEDIPSEDLSMKDLFRKIAHKLVFTLNNRITNEIYRTKYEEISKSHYLVNEMFKIAKIKKDKYMKDIKHLERILDGKNDQNDKKRKRPLEE